MMCSGCYKGDGWSSCCYITIIIICLQPCYPQALHSCAYSGALGRPLVCPADHVALLNADTLKHFTSSNYTAPRMVVAGAGMAHDVLVNLATPLFEGLGGAPATEPASKYVGGDWR